MIRVRQVKVEVYEYNESVLLSSTAKKLKINPSDIKKLDIIKQSIDARNKEIIYYIFEVNVLVDNELKLVNKLKNNDIFISPSLEYTFTDYGTQELLYPIVVVGSGPAGLFTTYNLLKNGYKVILIERGDNVDTRIKKINKFHETNELDPECNVQFGAGGAGTFSDGKLNTLVSDKLNRGRFVFETFIKYGANPDILYNFHPHIGTDVLQVVITKMLDDIIAMGGVVRFNTKLTDIIINENEVTGIVVNNSEVINTNNLVLAIGHSARDTYEMLNNLGISMSSKPFAIGLRVIHNQQVINESQYGKKYANILPPATYKVTYQSSLGRGVYSFCMCPGGYVVNSSSEEGCLCVNGMSYSNRDGENANSAIIVTISPKDFGENAMDGIKYLRDIETKTYNVGKGNVPIQLLKDYYLNKTSEMLGGIKPTIKGGYTLSNINEILPDYINDAIKEAFYDFDKHIKNFKSDDVILCASETRTSSPIRINRDDDYNSNIKGIYPVGEGAGYSGGITTSAIDGIVASEKIMHIYKAN